MFPSNRFIAVVGAVSFLALSAFAIQIGVKGIQAVQKSYTLQLEYNQGGDLDRDGIADGYDDSDGDTIPDKYDAVPFKALDAVVDFTLQ